GSRTLISRRFSKHSSRPCASAMLPESRLSLASPAFVDDAYRLPLRTRNRTGSRNFDVHRYARITLDRVREPSRAMLPLLVRQFARRLDAQPRLVERAFAADMNLEVGRELRIAD